MRIASISENKNIEKRVAITPEIAKKYLSNGFEVYLSENYANHLGFEDTEYSQLGVKFSKNEKDLINSADILAQLNILSDENLSYLKENQIIIGILNPFKNNDKLTELNKKKLIVFLLRCFQNHQSTIYGCFIFTSKFSRLQGCSRIFFKF